MDELQAARCSIEQAAENADELDRAIAGQRNILEITRLIADLQSHLHNALVRLPEIHREHIDWRELLHDELLKV